MILFLKKYQNPHLLSDFVNDFEISHSEFFFELTDREVRVDCREPKANMTE